MQRITADLAHVRLCTGIAVARVQMGELNMDVALKRRLELNSPVVVVSEKKSTRENISILLSAVDVPHWITPEHRRRKDARRSDLSVI